jgi:hypothetical protein
MRGRSQAEQLLIEQPRGAATWMPDQLANAVADELIDDRRKLPRPAREAMERICNYTVHFGV